MASVRSDVPPRVKPSVHCGVVGSECDVSSPPPAPRAEVLATCSQRTPSSPPPQLYVRSVRWLLRLPETPLTPSPSFRRGGELSFTKRLDASTTHTPGPASTDY